MGRENRKAKQVQNTTQDGRAEVKYIYQGPPRELDYTKDKNERGKSGMQVGERKQGLERKIRRRNMLEHWGD